LSISQTAEQRITVDAAPSSIDSANMSGSIDSSALDPGTPVELDAYVRFADGAALRLISVADAAPDFEYRMPKLAATSVSIVVQYGSSDTGFGLAHCDDVVVGQVGGVGLTIPSAVSLAPLANADSVDRTTSFAWNPAPPLALLAISCIDQS